MQAFCNCTSQEGPKQKTKKLEATIEAIASKVQASGKVEDTLLEAYRGGEHPRMAFAHWLGTEFKTVNKTIWLRLRQNICKMLFEAQIETEAIEEQEINKAPQPQHGPPKQLDSDIRVNSMAPQQGATTAFHGGMSSSLTTQQGNVGTSGGMQQPPKQQPHQPPPPAPAPQQLQSYQQPPYTPLSYYQQLSGTQSSGLCSQGQGYMTPSYSNAFPFTTFTSPTFGDQISLPPYQNPMMTTPEPLRPESPGAAHTRPSILSVTATSGTKVPNKNDKKKENHAEDSDVCG